MEQRLSKMILDGLDSVAVYASVLCAGVILVILMTCGEYSERLADNKVLALIALALMVPGAILYVFFSGRKRKIFRHPIVWLVLGYGLLFVVQVFWVTRVYFYTSWDVGLMKWWVEEIVNGSSMAAVSADVGYSIYPNNLFLFYLFCIIEKTGMFFSMSEPYHLCIYISCLCVNLSCFLGNLIIRKMTDSGIVRGYYSIVSTVLILFSPWIMIPYSDTYGMFFVMLGMWGLLCLEKKYLKWVVVAFAAIIGYRVKPTCIFPLFAAYITYGIQYMIFLKRHWKDLLALICSTLCFWCAGMLIPVWIQHTYSFRLDPDLQFPYTHYMMMGLNQVTNGGYNHDDFSFTNGFPDFATRKQADKDEFIRRLKDLREQKMLAEFLRAKAVINFNDGSFAWNGEGSFFIDYVEHDNILADWFQETMVPPDVWGNEGKYYYLYRTIVQTLWLSILLGLLFAGMGIKERRKSMACLTIVVCGLMAFVMLFEARARYLYLYSPVFLILSLCGWESLFRWVRRVYAHAHERINSFLNFC